ncbi:unnamed protein product [Hymenolepis diminuta]|uniref:Reverse transcriptase domain-containing protein n=1 Tax=Hymenolepis diminuta TaxID=6216 RepID=A0A3P6ZXY3_HYMDI|nr:unnamed protein product [Hymenolepis diminuta]
MMWKLRCIMTYLDISISTTAYEADSQLNPLGLDWLDQFGLLDLPINVVCNCACPATSTTYFRAKMMVPRFSETALIIVVLEKTNGTIRLYAAYSAGPNAALGPNCYPLVVPDDVFSISNGGRCFTKFDLAKAYLKIEVSPGSRELLTINTHCGLYQYTELSVDVKTTPANFNVGRLSRLNCNQKCRDEGTVIASLTMEDDT